MLLGLRNPPTYFIGLCLVLVVLGRVSVEPAIAGLESGSLVTSSSNKKSPPYGEFTLSTYKWEYAPWMRLFADGIISCSDSPKSFMCDSLDASAQILFTVMPDGEINGFEIVESVGDTNFTTEALECIKTVESPGPLPDPFPNDILEINIWFKCVSDQ